MDYALKVLTAPAYEPVSLAEMRSWFRLESDDTSLDTVLTLLRQAIREDAEHITGRAFIQRQCLLTLSEFPSDPDYSYRIELPFPPLVSVDSVKYRDVDGVLQTMDTADYDVHDDDDESRAYIVPARSASWPGVDDRPDAVQVTFTAGYAAGSPDDEAGQQANVPAKLKLWMQAKALTLEVNREQLSMAAVYELPRGQTLGLLDSLIVRKRFA